MATKKDNNHHSEFTNHVNATTANGDAPHIGNDSGPSDKKPTFNLKAVVNETGLKPDTLRAWERRYGLPNPERTGGGHRLYSQYDIDTLKWLIARQDEGMSISRAVKLWRQLSENGEDPLSLKQYALTEAAPTVANVVSGDNLAALRQSWIDACMNFDERGADTFLAEAFSLFPTETVCFELLQRGLSEIGIGWYEGRITVQQEHFASALAIRRLETMVAATPPPSRNGRILAVCPPEERHTFALLLITLLLRRNGWDVVYLGANVPAARLESTLATANPHLVLLSSQTLYTASTMLPMAKLLQRERVQLAYGGAVFTHIPVLRQKMPGYYLGERIERVPHMVEQLLTSPPPMPMYDQSTVDYQIALKHFQERRASIEAEVWLGLRGTSQQTYLNNANKELAQNIVAALTFGDMSLLSANLEWIEGLLINYHFRMPKKALEEYLASYRKACVKVLDYRGDLVVNWLGELLDN